MKKAIYLIVAAVTLISVTATAQESVKVPYQIGRDAKSKSDTLQNFHPHWFFQLQDGFNYSTNPGKFPDMITNNIQIGAGVNFTPALGARLILGYTAGTDNILGNYYRYKYFSGYLDGTVNISNIISGYRHDRFCDVYPYIGIGMQIGTENNSNGTLREMVAEDPSLMPYGWGPGQCFFALRAGVFGRFNLTEHASITLDVNLDGESPHMASVEKSGPELHFSTLVGIMFRLNPKTVVYSRAEAVASARESSAAAAAALMAANGAVFDGGLYADELMKAAATADSAAAYARKAAEVAYEAYGDNERDETVQAADKAVAAAGAAVVAADSARTKAGSVNEIAAKTDASAQAARDAAAAANEAINAVPFNKTAAIYASRAAEKAAEEVNAVAEDAKKLIADAPVVTANTLAAARAALDAAKAALDAAMLGVRIRPINENVFFALDKSVIRAGQPRATVDVVIAWLNKYPEAEIDLVGYASDESGGDSHNMRLSQKRVNAVRKALTKAGISAKRIHTDYKGERVQPFEINEQNRVVTCRMHPDSAAK